jgi:hypothetical protein
MPASPATVRSTLAAFRASSVLSRPEGEQWAGMIARISTPQIAAEFDEEAYDYFLDVLPPHWMGEGFMFAEGAEAFCYFWKANGKYFCRLATWEETVAFCAAAGIPTPS